MESAWIPISLEILKNLEILKMWFMYTGEVYSAAVNHCVWAFITVLGGSLCHGHIGCQFSPASWPGSLWVILLCPPPMVPWVSCCHRCGFWRPASDLRLAWPRLLLPDVPRVCFLFFFSLSGGRVTRAPVTRLSFSQCFQVFVWRPGLCSLCGLNFELF